MKIKVWIATNKVGSECSDVIEIDDDAWAAMSEKEREDECRGAAFNMGEWGFEIQS